MDVGVKKLCQATNFLSKHRKISECPHHRTPDTNSVRNDSTNEIGVHYWMDASRVLRVNHGTTAACVIGHIDST